MRRIQEAIELLKTNEMMIYCSIGFSHQKMYSRNHKAIELLETEPEPTEFTKDVRQICESEGGKDKPLIEIAPEIIYEACAIIDRLTAELRAKDEALREAMEKNGKKRGGCVFEDKEMTDQQ